MRKFLLPLLITTSLTACGGGGGGGGIVPFPDSPPPSEEPPAAHDLGLAWFTPKTVTTNPDTFKTAEFMVNGHMDRMNAEWAYGAAAFGSGVNVGVIDSHGRAGPNTTAEFGSRVTIRNYMPDDIGAGFEHANHVMGIIGAGRNEIGMHGVAPQSNLFVYGLIPSAGGSVSSTDMQNALTDALTNNVRIINNSWGSTPDRVGSEGELIVQAARSGMMMVFATGNDARDQPFAEAAMPKWVPDIKDNWIAVTSYNLNTNQLSGFANQCGDAKDWCLAAPGESVLSTSSTGFVLGTGTSMATPIVTGAAALLMSAYPELTNAQIQQLLFATADDLGTPGVDAVFGHGALNIDQAFRPFGSMTVVDATGEKSEALTAKTVGSVSPTLGSGFISAASAATLATRDGFNRIYDIPADLFMVESTRSSLRRAQSLADTSWRRRENPLGDERDIAVTMNFGPAAAVDPWSAVGGGLFGFNPLIDPDAIATSALVEQRVEEDMDWFAAATSAIPRSEGEPFHALGSVGLAGKREGFDWALALGVSAEKGGLLGETGSGLLETDGTTLSSFLSTGIGIHLNDRVRVGIEGHAMAMRYGNGSSLIESVEGFGTSWALSASIDEVLMPGDTVSLSLSKPLEIHDGTLEMTSIGRIPGTGEVGTRTVSSAFSSQSDVVDLGLAWSKPLDIAEEGRLSVGFSQSISTIGESAGGSGVFGRLEMKF